MTAILYGLHSEFNIDLLWAIVGPGLIPRHVDQRNQEVDLMEKVIGIIEQEISHRRLNVSSQKKARVMRLVYEKSAGSGVVNLEYMKKMILLTQ